MKYLEENRSNDELCAPGQEKIYSHGIEFGDLTGDGKEEAVVEAQTCAMHTGGSDIIEVYSLSKEGQLRSLPIDWKNPKLNIPDGYERNGSGSYRLDIRDGYLVTWYPVIRKGDSKDWVWTVRYRWKKSMFVPNRVEIVPYEGW